MDLTIYHAPNTRSIRVIWLCEELGLPYQIVPVDFSPEYRATAEWRAMNPVGKVPVLTDGDLKLFESGAMIQYVLARYGEGRLQPQPGSDAEALFWQWLWFGEATFARPLGEIVNHRREFPGDAQQSAVLDEMKNRAVQCGEAVAAQVADRPYLLGDEFTAADIMNGYSVMLIELLIPEAMPESLIPYWGRLKERTGFQKARAT